MAVTDENGPFDLSYMSLLFVSLNPLHRQLFCSDKCVAPFGKVNPTRQIEAIEQTPRVKMVRPGAIQLAICLLAVLGSPAMQDSFRNWSSHGL
jgi:hypothetical protein